MTKQAISQEALRALLLARDSRFWPALADCTAITSTFTDLLALSALRKQGRQRQPEPTRQPLRLALIGGCSFFPLADAIEHFLAISGIDVEIFLGGYGTYEAEIRSQKGPIFDFRPEVTLLVPTQARCRYEGGLSDRQDLQRRAAESFVDQLLELCDLLHKQSRSEILLGNFIPVGTFDPGPLRSRTLGASWSFCKLVNLELGLRAPSFVQVCDLEFLSSRRGLATAVDERGWFESKQIGAPDLLLDIAREVAHLVCSLRQPPAKLLVVDLDNTIWGGVIGDDGLDGIELGDTSPRGEAFKAFQRCILDLSARGILLAVCSKNDPTRAREPFEQHPEMVLRLEHFAAFVANWEPKADNLRAIAKGLDLGLDSMVFVDDTAAEIDMVRRFAPEVRTILLGPDPATYSRALLDSRFFEPLTITAEDIGRSKQYQIQQQRKALLGSAANMEEYLESLEMCAQIRRIDRLDLPRIAQLVNKSNQFNLTTIRRTEAELHRMTDDASTLGFTLRLADRFGDHGLVSVLICRRREDVVEIDTWVMSCRVLQRRVEEEALNEVFRIAASVGASRVLGRYLPTPKNELVRDLFPRLGFTVYSESERESTYLREVLSYRPIRTSIAVNRSES